MTQTILRKSFLILAFLAGALVLGHLKNVPKLDPKGSEQLLSSQGVKVVGRPSVSTGVKTSFVYSIEFRDAIQQITLDDFSVEVRPRLNEASTVLKPAYIEAHLEGASEWPQAATFIDLKSTVKVIQPCEGRCAVYWYGFEFPDSINTDLFTALIYLKYRYSNQAVAQSKEIEIPLRYSIAFVPWDAHSDVTVILIPILIFGLIVVGIAWGAKALKERRARSLLIP